jgi:hypothetical protein
LTAPQEPTAEQVNCRRHAHQVDWRACPAQVDSRQNTPQRPHAHARSSPIVVEWVQRLQTASKATHLQKSMPLFVAVQSDYKAENVWRAAEDPLGPS